MAQMAKWNLPGVYTHSFMDAWSPGYLGSVAYNHNGLMTMYETQSPRDFDVESLRAARLEEEAKEEEEAEEEEQQADSTELIRQIAAAHELGIISGKVARDHQWLKGTSPRVLLQGFPRLRKQFWGRHLWARGYLAVSSGNITDEMIREYNDEQEGEQIADDSRFPIDRT
jgi:putative transposase